MIKYLYEWFISKGRNEVHKVREEKSAHKVKIQTSCKRNENKKYSKNVHVRKI